MDNLILNLVYSAENRSEGILATASPGIARSNVLFASRVLLIALDIPSLVFNILLLICLRLASGRHANVRLIIGNISIAAILVSCNQLIRSSYYLSHYLTPTSLVSSRIACSISELFKSASVRTTVLMIFGAAVERFVATKFHANYETRSYALAFVICAAVWAQALLTNVIGILMIREDRLIPYCTLVATMERNVAAGLLLFYFIMVIASALAYVAIYWQSKRILANFEDFQEQLTLSSRMQLRHTVELTITLVPSIVLNCILWATVQIYMVLIKFEVIGNLSNDQTIVLLSLCDIAASFYYLAHAILLFWRSELLKEKLITQIFAKLPFLRKYSKNWSEARASEKQQRSRTPDVARRKASMEDAHFEYLQLLWQKKPSRATGARPKQSTVAAKLSLGSNTTFSNK